MGCDPIGGQKYPFTGFTYQILFCRSDIHIMIIKAEHYSYDVEMSIILWLVLPQHKELH